jgi:4-hydroxy-3-methylbut-2-enyl diphosphate reductase
MRILVADTAGFCMGVRRAVELALDNASAYPEGIRILGPLIHNRQAVEMLEQRGARLLDETDALQPGSRVLIRAHGVPPQLQESMAARGCVIIDGTCPKVKTVQKVISRYRSMGYEIVISGDEGHAEVVGLLGYAGESGHLIQSPDDVDALPRWDKVCLVSQTTFDRNSFEAIAERVKERFADSQVVVKRTICSATDKRQQQAMELAKRSDAMIVVGGTNSANTLRLADIARRYCPVVQHVETETEIMRDGIAGCDTIGVTAGASTPNWMMKRVVDHLEHMSRAREGAIRRFARQTVDTLAYLNVFVAAGAAAMYYVSCYLQELHFHWSGLALAFLYFLSMHLWNSLSSMEMTQHHGISRYRFYNAHKTGLFGLTALAIVVMLSISFLMNRTLFYLMLFSTAAGSVYHTTIVPKALRKIVRYGTLRDIPTSRDLFVALAWGILLTFVPQAIEQSLRVAPAAWICFLWIFLLAYLRSLIFDLRDIEGDRIMGRETLVSIIGEKRVRTVMFALTLGLLFAPILFSTGQLLLHRSPSDQSIAYLVQVPVLLYVLFLLQSHRWIALRHTSLFSLIADGQFYVSAFFAWLGAWLFR